MAKNKKRKKAVLKAKRELAGRKKFVNNAREHGIKKVRALAKQLEEMRSHKANTIGDQAEDLFAKLAGHEEEE